MPRPRERVYTLDKQKKHLARLSLLSAKRFRFNAHANGRRYAVPFSGLFGIVCYRIPSFCRTFSTMVYACLLMIFFPWATHAKA